MTGLSCFGRNTTNYYRRQTTSGQWNIFILFQYIIVLKTFYSVPLQQFEKATRINSPVSDRSGIEFSLRNLYVYRNRHFHPEAISRSQFILKKCQTLLEVNPIDHFDIAMTKSIEEHSQGQYLAIIYRSPAHERAFVSQSNTTLYRFWKSIRFSILIYI